MSRQKILGLLILGVGGALGFAVEGPTGLALVAVFLVVGLGVFFAREGRGLLAQRGSPKPRVLILLKEIHARPQRGGKFREIADRDEGGLELEVFINCWFLNESDVGVQLVGETHLSLETRRGGRKLAERVPSDLNQWQLGSLVRDEWDPDIIRARQQAMPELNITQPLACGVPRHGWTHFRLRDVSPVEFQTGTLQLSVNDSLGNTHVGTGGARFLPGRVWPGGSASPPPKAPEPPAQAEGNAASTSETTSPGKLPG